MNNWTALSIDEKIELLRKTQAQWGSLVAPRLGELRTVIDAQEREIARLTRRIETLERQSTAQSIAA